jgi:hypothetical protein
MANSNFKGRWRATICAAIALAMAGECGVSATPAAGEPPKVVLSARFTPYYLGASTTIHLAFNVSPTVGVASPVTDVQVYLPAGMGLGTTNLGEETCNPSELLARGTEGCSPNSRMGLGEASVEIPVENHPRISAKVTLYMGVPHEQHTTLLLYAVTTSAVSAQFLFPTELLPSSGIFGAELHTSLPPIATWPDGPSAVIVHMETSLGPSHLTYYRERHGKRVAYQPSGIAIPEVCPRGGFPFAAHYRFLNGSSTVATTTVPCPPRHHKR